MTTKETLEIRTISVTTLTWEKAFLKIHFSVTNVLFWKRDN